MRLKHIIKGVPVIPALLLALTLSVLTGCSSTRENDASDKTPVLWSLPLNSGGSQPSDIYGDLAVGSVDIPEGDNGVLTFVDLDKREVIWQGEDGLGLVIDQTMVSNGTNWFVNNDELRRVEVYQNSGALVGTFEYDLENGVNLKGLRPIVVNDTLYIAQGRGLYTFDISQADTLNLLWSKELPYALSSLAANEDGIYAGTRNYTGESNVFKLDAAIGETIWEATTYEEVSWEPSPPASLAIKGTRLFANASNTMQAFDTDSGERAWLSELVVCGEYDSSPGDVLALDDTSIYFTKASCVVSVAQNDGKINWLMNGYESEARYSFSAKPIVHNGVVYAVNSFLWGIDAKTGNVLSRSTNFDYSQFAYIHEYKNQIIVWGANLFAYKPVR